MSLRPSISARATSTAFTLVELLAAMGVLTLLLVVVVQMINSVSTVTTSTSHHLDADAQARLVFDRMAVDFTQIVKRTDADYYFVKKPAPGGGNDHNDQIAFYSETSGYYPSASTRTQQSNVALVGYCINSQYQLARLNKALIWNGVNTGSNNDRAMTFLPQLLPNIWSTAFHSADGSQSMSGDRGIDQDYQVIGESVFRLEVCYLMPKTAVTAADGSTSTATVLSDTPYLVPGATPTPSAALPAGQIPYNGMRDVAAVIVTLAVLDDASRLLVPKVSLPTVLSAVAAKLDDVPATPNTGGTPVTLTSTPGKLWQAHVDNGDLAGPALLPRRAASQVRIYERYFPLGNSH